MALGCASHTAVIRDRISGAILFGGGDLIELDYNRILNDVSAARVVIGISGPECCADLDVIRSWRCQLAIYRDDVFMWDGPIVNIDWNVDEITVAAVDVLGWLDRRVPHQAFTFTADDLTEIARQLIEDGFAPDDPGHSVTVVSTAGVTGGREYELNVGQTGDHLRDLSDTGIDYTAVGNNIVLMGDDFCEVVGRLTDTDLPDGVTVTEDGGSLATRWVVAGSDASGALGTAGGTDSYYGLLERYEEQTNISTQAAADDAAAARLRASLPVPTVIATQNVTLSPEADIDVSSLVPGWCLDITTSLTCREITQRLKITGVSFHEDADQERVQVQVAATASTS